MKLKTIRKVLKDKISDWIESVTDLEVRNAIERSSIVTGGSIASMLLKEPVNDYDIYFTNKKDLLKVVEYYAKGVNEVELLVEGEKEKRKKKSKFYPVEEDKGDDQYSRAWRTMEEGQIKFFINGNKGIHVIENKKPKNKKKQLKYIPACFSPNAITLTDDIQIVIRFYGPVEEIHKNYDFVHATNSYTYRDNNLNLRREALEALLTKELKYIGSKYPITSIIRSKKFLGRGFTINAGEYLKIMYQISALDLNDIDVLEEQLVGVDVAYFSSLIIALRNIGEDKKDEKGKLKVGYPYIFRIIDEIFN